MIVKRRGYQKVVSVNFVMKARSRKLGAVSAANIALFNKLVVLSESEQIHERLREDCRELRKELRQMMLQMMESQPIEKLLEVPRQCGVIERINQVVGELGKVDWRATFLERARQIDSHEVRHIAEQVENNGIPAGFDSVLLEVFGRARDELFNGYFEQAVALEAIVHAATFEQCATNFFKVVGPQDTCLAPQPVVAPGPVDEETEKQRKILERVSKDIDSASTTAAKDESDFATELQKLRTELNDPKRTVSGWETANKEWAQKLAQENRTETPKPATEQMYSRAPARRQVKVETTPVSSGTTEINRSIAKLDACFQAIRRLKRSNNGTTLQDLAAALDRVSRKATEIEKCQREFDQVFKRKG